METSRFHTALSMPAEQQMPTFASIGGILPRPRSKRVFLHRPMDPCIVEARPDLSFLIKSATDSERCERPLLGWCFLVGPEGHAFDIDTIARSYHRGSLPILRQEFRLGALEGSVSALCKDQRLHLRLDLRSRHPGATQHLRLLGSLSRTSYALLCGDPNEDYIPFESDSRAWQDPLPLVMGSDVASSDGRIRFVLPVHEGFTLGCVPCHDGTLLSMDVSLAPGESAAVELVIPYEPVPSDQAPVLLALRWAAVLEETTAYYEGQRKRGTQLRTPEPEVDRLFDVLRLSSLQMLGSKPGTDRLYPGQGGFNDFGVIYAQEASAWLPVLVQLGFHDEVRRVMDHLLTTQDGSPGPDGDIEDPTGSFRPHIHWMCETGAVLFLVSQHALHAADGDWFRNIQPRLLSACEFIRRERARTKTRYAEGTAGYGLLPPGRVHDWPDYGQFFFSDAYTWQGLEMSAILFKAFGHPDAAWLASEAEDYRRCILASFERSIHPHPSGDGTSWFSNEVHTPAGQEVGSFGGDSPICLAHTGILPADDARLEALEFDTRRRGYMTSLFTHLMSGMEDAKLGALQRERAGGDYDLLYITQSELPWHRVYMERGERGRALAYFYATLAYGTTYDLGLTQERYCPQLPWLLPWQPNASANGRILTMIITSICHRVGDDLFLLAGAPDAWLDGNIRLSDLEVAGGRISVQTKRSGNRLVVSVRFVVKSAAVAPKRLVFCLPEGWHPSADDAEPALASSGPHGWSTAGLKWKTRHTFLLDY